MDASSALPLAPVNGDVGTDDCIYKDFLLVSAVIPDLYEQVCPGPILSLVNVGGGFLRQLTCQVWWGNAVLHLPEKSPPECPGQNGKGRWTISP